MEREAGSTEREGDADTTPTAKARSPIVWRQALALVLVLLVAAGIRLISLPHEAVWYDEIATLGFLDAPTLSEFLKQTHAVTPVPPVYSITQFFWSRVFGDTILSLRVLSLIYGLAGVAALYGFGRALFGHRAGLIAAVWMTFSFWHIYYSQEIRFYGMVAFLGILTVWTFVRFVNRPTPGTLAIHALSSGVMIWTHPHAVFVFVALGLFLLGFRREHPRLIAAWTGVHLALAATLAVFILSIDRDVAYAQTGWLSRPTIWRGYPSLRGFLAMGSGLMEFTPVNAAGETMLSWRRPLWIVAEWIMLGAFLSGICLLLRSRKSDECGMPITPREIGVLLALWFVVPPLLAYLGSYAWRPIFHGRYLLFAFPPFYLAAGYLLRNRTFPLVAMAMTPLILFDALFYFPGPMRAPYDRVVATIQADSTPVRDIYIDDMIALASIEYYWDGPAPEILRPHDIERVVNIHTGEINFQAPSNWLLLSDEKRAHYMRGDLRRANADFEVHYLPALRPLWLFHVRANPLAEMPKVLER